MRAEPIIDGWTLLVAFCLGAIFGAAVVRA